MRPASLILAAALLHPSAVWATPATPAEIASCIAQNFPEAGQIESIALTVTDRSGGERHTHASIYSRHDSDGLQRILVRFDAPPDLVGASFLMLESESGPNELVVRLPGVEGVKHIRGVEAGKRMFGSDFSYEDFERLQGLVRPGNSTLQPEAEIAGRAVWVVETHPHDRMSSAYERLLSSIDQETCVVLRSELYEPGGQLRKVLTADPDLVRQVDGVWVAHDVRMEDRRDSSSTRLRVESIQSDVQIPPLRFSVKELSSWKPEGIQDPIAPEEADLGSPQLELDAPKR